MSQDATSAELLRRERERGERRLASARVAVLASLLPILLPLTLLAEGGDRPIQFRALAIVGGGVAGALGWRWAIRRKPYRVAHSYASSTFDLLLAVLVILDWSYYDGRWLPTQARFGVGYGALFMVIILTGVRFDYRTVLLATFETVAFYSLYVWFTVTVSHTPLLFGSEETIAANGLNSVELLGRVALLLGSGLLMAYLMRHAEGVVRRSVQTAEEKGRLRQFITANVVDEIESGRASLDLAGQKRRVTVMFSDIRDFTALGEATDAVALLDLLNAFYEFTAEEIFKHHGTVDKYMGDGVMALFGAPQALDNCSLAAVRCAEAMLAKVEAFNALHGRDIRIGIGLYTGEVAVGNLGTQSYKSYTAIGEGVNLAARIESATRACDAALLFSESVKRDVEATVPVRAMGEFPLKGVSKPVALFSTAKGG